MFICLFAITSKVRKKRKNFKINRERFPKSGRSSALSEDLAGLHSLTNRSKRSKNKIRSFYSELYDSDQATIQTDLEEVPPIMAWEVEAALRKMGKKRENSMLTLKADETIAKELATSTLSA